MVVYWSLELKVHVEVLAAFCGRTREIAGGSSLAESCMLTRMAIESQSCLTEPNRRACHIDASRVEPESSPEPKAGLMSSGSWMAIWRKP